MSGIYKYPGQKTTRANAWEYHQGPVAPRKNILKTEKKKGRGKYNRKYRT
jgi:hypothetical protein